MISRCWRPTSLLGVRYSSPLNKTRCLSTHSLDKLLSKPVQSYISTTRDPYLNLSIEHHILQKADPESTILFLYVNRPSIILGRNQNPWLEVNLALLNTPDDASSAKPRPHNVDLVRRRSGGGTVFHDEGNVNWAVICPSAEFTRDKHAEMVVRALRGCGIDRARVNTRHDIVLDQGERRSDTSDSEDTHATPYQLSETDSAYTRPLKVSGSAYKLTRRRALHHGTCLLSSPFLSAIPEYLHSPARPYLSARGVDSVSSPVTNINLSNVTFIAAVQAAFAKMYHALHDTPPVEVGDDLFGHEEIRKGYDELVSPEWKFLQTPQFTLNTRDALRESLHNVEITARYGEITGVADTSELSSETSDERPSPSSDPSLLASHLSEILVGHRINEVQDWNDVLLPASSLPASNPSARKELAEWLNRMLPHVR